MKKQNSGFTLIELIAVIVILGILAATAVPKFIDLSGAAKESSVKGLAGSLNSASSVNFAAYSACKAKLTGSSTGAIVDTVTGAGTPATGCGVAAGKFVTIDTSIYTITGTYDDTLEASSTCTVSDDSTPANTATFTMYAVQAGSLSCP